MAAPFTIGWVKPKRELRKLFGCSESDTFFNREFPGDEGDLIIVGTDIATTYGGWLIRGLGVARAIYEATSVEAHASDVESDGSGSDEGSDSESSSIDSSDPEMLDRSRDSRGRRFTLSCVRELDGSSSDYAEVIHSSEQNSGHKASQASSYPCSQPLPDVELHYEGGSQSSSSGGSSPVPEAKKRRVDAGGLQPLSNGFGQRSIAPLTRRIASRDDKQVGLNVSRVARLQDNADGVADPCTGSRDV